MSNINLVAVTKQGRESSPLNASILTAAVVLIILIAAYGAIVWLGNKKEAESQVLEQEYAGERAKLTSDKNRDIVDFQNRIIIAKGALGQANNALGNLLNMEKTVVGGAHLSSFDYDKNTRAISIEGIADNYDIFAQQILSFKKADYVAGVNIGKSTKDDKGKINFSLILNVN